MKLFFLVLMVNAKYLLGQKVIWDNEAEINYSEHDFLAKGGEIRFPNWVFIFPGTKWCGAGNIAESDDDLGLHAATDKCCRNHDFCSDVIEAHETKHNLTNPSFYSRVHCDCDDEFKKCLKSVSTKTSNQVGVLYFTALNTQCFKNEFPIKKCVKYTYFPTRKCVQYKLDKTGEKKYQWFDVPNY